MGLSEHNPYKYNTNTIQYKIHIIITYRCLLYSIIMSFRRHSDYNSYLTNLKHNNLGNFLSEQHYSSINTRLSSLQNSFDNDYLRRTENVYLSKTPNFKDIGLDSITTIITQPVDLTTNFFSIFKLPTNNQIQNGTFKNIINTCEITQNKLIYVYSVKSNNTGGFNNLGNIFNCYVFPCAGDNLLLCWSSDEENWCVQKYGGYFTNYSI